MYVVPMLYLTHKEVSVYVVSMLYLTHKEVSVYVVSILSCLSLTYISETFFFYNEPSYKEVQVCVASVYHVFSFLLQVVWYNRLLFSMF